MQKFTSQLSIFDKAYSLIADKQKYKSELSNGISLEIFNEQQQNCLRKSFLCCGCLPNESERLKKFQDQIKSTSKKAVLSNRQENQTLFELKNGKSAFIGSWYDILIFQQWEDIFHNQNAGIKFQSTEVPFEPQSMFRHNQTNWFSKISIWFSNQQFKFAFTNKKEHEHVFNLLITLKLYYINLHPESQHNSLTLRHFVQHNQDKDTMLNKSQIIKIMEEMNFSKQQFQKYIQEIPEYKETQSLSKDGFMELIQVLKCPENLYPIYKKYGGQGSSYGTTFDRYSEKCMTQKQFQKFMRQIQEEDLKPQNSSILFSDHRNSKKKTQAAQSSTNLSFIDFCHHILSNSKNPSILPQQIDTSKPLPYYYVNSSHNTYLVGNQLTSMSSANVYYLNLIEGIRCVELDIHDGQYGPIIKHGFTFTAQISFDEAIRAIMKFCLQNPNHTPIILSFENHCTEPNRKLMAKSLDQIPFSKFYVIPQNGTNQMQFATLRQLTGKIIIQGTGVFSQLYPDIKKFQRKQQSIKKQIRAQSLVLNFAQQNKFLLEMLGKKPSKEQEKFMQTVKQLQKRKEEAENTLRNAHNEIVRRNNLSSRQLKKYYGIVAAPFSLGNTCWQMANIAENNLLKMVKGDIQPSADQIYQYSWNSMIRIYPFGLRFDSSNYNPIPMLQCGCQLVSLNTQNVDVNYVAVQGIFQKNKNCGFALKRDIKKQNHQKYRFRIIFMNCIDIRPRKQLSSDENTCLQVSFLGSSQDMMTNFKYVNTSSDPQSVSQNEPVTVSYPFLSKCLQTQLSGLPEHTLFNPPLLIAETSSNLYPFVELEISSLQFANLYLNVPHCGSMSVPLKDFRTGFRVIPIYCFEIGRKKTMGHVLVWSQIKKV